ncbi:hypothetical protein A3Q29_21400 [Providencia stuartii]|uniref:Heavy metal-binding domain-containing protein n=1 Tax=Providencia stuartii TaxID=588 RepID=A0A1S1HLW9_PROST|nr:hypothetical protein A3Q29_21400 [Providencia stuartii]
MGIFSVKPKFDVSNFNGIYSSENVQNGKVIKNFGLVIARCFDIVGDAPDIHKLLKEQLMDEAIKLDANSIINFKIESGTYLRDGYKWFSSYLVAYGDAVFVEYND